MAVFEHPSHFALFFFSTWSGSRVPVALFHSESVVVFFTIFFNPLDWAVSLAAYITSLSVIINHKLKILERLKTCGLL